MAGASPRDRLAMERGMGEAEPPDALQVPYSMCPLQRIAATCHPHPIRCLQVASERQATGSCSKQVGNGNGSSGLPKRQRYIDNDPDAGALPHRHSARPPPTPPAPPFGPHSRHPALCPDLPSRPSGVAESLIQTAQRVFQASGGTVEPCAEARRPEELSDGFLARALDALQLAVAACPTGINEHMVPQ